MAKFQPGNPGKPKGAKHGFTVRAKEAFRLAFDKSGGVEALTAWAIENRTDFYKLYARLIPVEVQATVEQTVNVHEMTDEQLAVIAAGSSLALAAPAESAGKPN